jgi:hypothetical protein
MVSRSPSEFTSISGWRTETNSASRAIMVPSVGASRSVRVRYVFSRKRLLELCQNCVCLGEGDVLVVLIQNRGIQSSLPCVVNTIIVILYLISYNRWYFPSSVECQSLLC